MLNVSFYLSCVKYSVFDLWCCYRCLSIIYI